MDYFFGQIDSWWRYGGTSVDGQLSWNTICWLCTICVFALLRHCFPPAPNWWDCMNSSPLLFTPFSRSVLFSLLYDTADYRDSPLNETPPKMRHRSPECTYHSPYWAWYPPLMRPPNRTLGPGLKGNFNQEKFVTFFLRPYFRWEQFFLFFFEDYFWVDFSNFAHK